jgi:hypothetical protein
VVFTLAIAPGPVVVVEAWDAVNSPPVMGHPEMLDESGRGLMLVGALSSRWGWYPSRVGAIAGKTVWAEITATDLPAAQTGPSAPVGACR